MRLFFCSLLLAALVTSVAQADPGELRCADVTLPVALAPNTTVTYDLYGVLCARGGIHQKTFQIALHGATYGHLYWDWPFQPEHYSYMRQATAAGYAVLNLDRIGSGRSAHPPAEMVDIESNAYVVHQVVQILRAGTRSVPVFGPFQAGKIALVGHSLGSLIAITEAATYGDVDGVVLTGISHTVTPRLGDVSFYPASLDPRFAGKNLPDGYLTTVPGTRDIFYQVPFFSPKVLSVDEQKKETVTVAELNSAVPALSLTTGIHVPVLLAVGDFDGAFCNPPSCTASGSLAVEADSFAPDTCLETRAIPQSGHDLNLHFHAPLTYAILLNWMNRRVGRNPNVAPPFPCRP
ncbi:MAG TPA: alpha/beta fold hydrolase [Thermoanaerobaculia bacterium]|nr:alpha/beta fold hydrolase [Thermoanaerobaculia bacterium]